MEPYYTYLLAGITEICFQMNFKLLLSSCTTNINEKEELSIYAEYVESQAVDGLIVTTPKSCDERIKFLVETKQNFVVLGRSNISLDFPWVDIDGSYGMSEAVRYLSTLGHKRIGYIGTPNIFMFSRHRLEGYERGLNNCNIEFDPELVVEVSINEDEVEAGEKGILQLLRLNLPPKAVIVSGNQLALGVIKGINKFGYAVGKDISLICFDDAEWNVHFNPPITSIRQPIYETGKMLSKILIQQIKGVKIKDSHILLKPELIIRESCKKYG
ncbi:MAG: substrate-binding domain-containing protein [Deltaproteobacteria bacterium]|nr:substrate-binding domain-containing protein [Deltaproteobacteria bacterium]